MQQMTMFGLNQPVKDKGINVLSLFDGMSVGLQALKQAGIKVNNYFASEIEPSSIEVSQDNHPEIKRLGDVTKWREWALPKIDLVIGGSPCQGFSRQGVGLNFEDQRSKLFFDFVDIVNYHKENNPEMKFMLENVDMKKEWEALINKYTTVDGIHINSDIFIAHNRPRTYWTDIKLKELQQKQYKLLDLLDNITLTDYTLIGDVKVSNEYSEASKELLSLVNGELRVKQAVKAGYAVAEIGDGINISFPTSKTRRGRVVKNRSSCLDTSCDIGVYDGKKQVRKFTINELERLQGLPPGYTRAVNEKKAKQMLGNGWTVNVIEWILEGLK